MKKINLYTYKIENGGFMETPTKIEGIKFIGLNVRLISEGKKLLTNGEKKVRSIKVPSEEVGLWNEIEATPEEIKDSFLVSLDEVNYKELLNIITGEEEVIE